MGKFILSFFLLLSIFSGFSQSNIQVQFPGAENKTAFVWAYADYISLTKTVIGEYDIDKNGVFNFTLNLSNPKPIFIQVQFIRIQIFIEPKRDYKIEIENINFSNPELYPKSVIGYLSPNFKILKPSTHELNKGLDGAKKLFSSFIDSNYISLIRGYNTQFLVDSFSLVIDNYTKSFGNKYLNNFTNFQMTELRLLSRDYSNQMIVDKYFIDGEINIDDPYSMNFFNSFWSNYIIMKGKGYSPFQIDSVINKEQSYQALSALLAKDPLLKDSVLRELVIIRNIPQLYANRKFNKKALINILYDISGSKIKTEHQIIASNVRKQLTSLQVGSPAPDFEFIDIKGNKFKLSDFEGYYVYLNVWNTECPDCLAEMQYTKELFEEYDDIIVFISISVDADTSVMKEYIEHREFAWTFAHIDQNYTFLNNYHISILPRYILINKEAEIEMLNAPSPSNHFSDYFLKMLNDKKGNLKIRSD